MKILMIIDNLSKGGKERRLLELLRYFDSLGSIYSTLVVLKDQIEYDYVSELKNTNLIIFHRKIKKDPFVYFKLWKLGKQLEPDLIHSWGVMPSVYIATISFLQRIPLINSMVANAMCPPFSKVWFRSRLTIPFSRVILANSQAGLKAYRINNKKGRVIYNGFNFDRIANIEQANKVREQFGLSTKYIGGMVASFDHRKDFDLFLEAADIISKRRNNISFLAVGDGPERKRLMKKYKNNKKIIFTGNIENAESIINLFTFGILMSNPTTHQEGISNSILEMMALKKPVIASIGGGTIEIVIDEKSGFLIEPENIQGLVEKIELLIDNPKLRTEMGQKGLEIVKEKFDMIKMSRSFVDLYKEVLYK